jgi:hypothetical protein
MKILQGVAGKGFSAHLLSIESNRQRSLAVDYGMILPKISRIMTGGARCR